MIAIDSISRRFVPLIAGAALALASCSGGGETSAPASGASGEYTVADDYILGDANAPVTLVEYASVGCGACAGWHQNVYPDIKARYVDTGKVKYVFRPFPAGYPEMADAGHKLALCADRNKFFKNIKLQFDRQQQIIEMRSRPNGLRQAYFSLAKSSGLSEDEFTACLIDTDVKNRYEAFIQLGQDEGVAGTPSVFINGTKTDHDLETLQTKIAELLGEPAPEKADAE